MDGKWRFRPTEAVWQQPPMMERLGSGIRITIGNCIISRIREFPTAFAGPVTGQSWFLDRKGVAFESGMQETETLIGLLLESVAVQALAVSPNGTYLAVGGKDGAIHLLRWPELTSVSTFLGHRGFVESLAFSPDCDWLVSGDDWDDVRFWKVPRKESQENASFRLIEHGRATKIGSPKLPFIRNATSLPRPAMMSVCTSGMVETGDGLIRSRSIHGYQV